MITKDMIDSVIQEAIAQAVDPINEELIVHLFKIQRDLLRLAKEAGEKSILSGKLQRVISQIARLIEAIIEQPGECIEWLIEEVKR